MSLPQVAWLWGSGGRGASLGQVPQPPGDLPRPTQLYRSQSHGCRALWATTRLPL